MQINHEYKKKWREFGRHCDFETTDCEAIIDFKPNAEYQSKYIQRNPIHVGVQFVPELSEHFVDMKTIELKDSGMTHLEGGWPKEVDSTQAESKNRYLKKASNEEKVVKSSKTIGELLEHYVKQNIAVDVYENYFSTTASVTEDYRNEAPSAKTIAVFKDPAVGYKRTATHISWLPTDGKKLAVAYSVLQFQQMPEGMSTDSYIWDVSNPNEPEQKLSPTSPLCCIEYNVKETNTLIGGCYNGVVALFDVRKGSSPAETSSIKVSHRDPIYDIKWIQSKSSTVCLSTSTDGQCIIWDTRQLNEPVEAYQLIAPDNSPNFKGLMGGESLCYDITNPTKFMVGTEQGLIVSCARRKNKGMQVEKMYHGHHGPIYSVHKNPFLPKFFLTVGDWSAKIYMEELSQPIVSTRYHDSYLTNGCWSTSRPGVFFTTKKDGTMDVWDFLFKQSRPLLTLNISNSALQTISMYNGRHLAVGGVDGTTSMIELSDGLSGMQNNERLPITEEKNAIQAMFDRETKREKILEENKREALIAAKKRADSKNSKKADLFTIDESDLKELTEYFEGCL
ncbi:dynein intermediate chain [Acrasis kona]|uniref:Dynein intermediate chain n=1 Tax=Acrasis kona TaxID=1008807 RepID=A0AAW2YZT8_9EUKA